MEIYIAGEKQSVDTGDTYFKQIAQSETASRITAINILALRQKLTQLEVADMKPLEARIEFARWIVDCPNCKNAEFAFEDKLFYCSQCANKDVEGNVRKVKMPNNRKQIEGILANRKIINRHWFPNETEAKLKEENNKGVL